jgi:hypothetical protein
MTRVLRLSAVEQAVRAKVCAGCSRRTTGGDAGGEHPRPCESTCAQFRIGPAMRRAMHAVQASEESPASDRARRGRAFEKVLRQLSGK